VAALLGAVLVLGACASQTDGGLETTTSTPEQEETPSLEASCGAVELGGGEAPALPDTPVDDETMAAVMAGVDAVAAGEATFFDEHEWFVATSGPDRLTLFGRPRLEPPADAPPYADAVFARNGDTWEPEGWGQCRVEIGAPGFGNAHWVTHPDQQPDPSSDQLNILINENNCASGEAPVGREIVPVVVADPDRITISVLVEPVEGDADCPSNPWHPITVDLPTPAGDRPMYDGSVSPALERPWPPTATSLDSLGRDQ
jgi:hypothetical protein